MLPFLPLKLKKRTIEINGFQFRLTRDLYYRVAIFFPFANLTFRWRQHPGCSPKTPNRKGHESRHSITDHERALECRRGVGRRALRNEAAGGVRDQG